ncbi:MAG: hypothetical protein NT011_13525 [Kiritimatiellaeota bacterium]|nr:hypothetical protein [Kiritimatiellota bacterium]
MRHNKKVLLDAIHVIVSAAEDIADHWDKEQYREISRDVVAFRDRTFPRKSFLPPMTREKILTLFLIVTRSGIEAVQDYQGGDYAGMAKDVIKLAKRIEQAKQKETQCPE